MSMERNFCRFDMTTMFTSQRREVLRRVEWNRFYPDAGSSDKIAVLDCWKFDRLDRAVRDHNYRLIDLEVETAKHSHGQYDIEQRLERWLHLESRTRVLDERLKMLQDPYTPLPLPDTAGPPDGGIRLVLCERFGSYLGMAMSERAFLHIETAFNLHPTTLPAFDLDRGTYALYDGSKLGDQSLENGIHIVIKAPQKMEVANYLLSLHHDVTTGFTSALICGDGVLVDRDIHTMYGSQFNQLIKTILEDPTSWDNPLFLPSVILQNHIYRLDLRADSISSVLAGIETDIGVTHAGPVRYDDKRSHWPEDIDPKSTTLELNSITTELIYLNGCMQWSCLLASHLLAAIEELESHKLLIQRHSIIQRLKQAIRYLQNTAVGVQNRYVYNRERADLQLNVLFNIISQQSAIVNRRDAQLNSRIALSSKQDSISVSTFTFLTALFLPGTFVAALFSMSMFNWQPDDDNDGSNRVGYVSSNFWIFWVVTVPLTILVMSSWYLWSRHANAKWLKQLRSDALKQHGSIETYDQT